MSLLEQAWYKNSLWLTLLKPFSALFRYISQRRRNQYLKGSKQAYKSKLPVIVVGNITVGGTGKTPLVIYLASKLIAAGYTPGIVSRGYQSKAKNYPFVVTPNSKPEISGDEPLLLAQNTGCPVIIDADRVSALKKMESDFNCDVVLSDDGLQHYAMGRDIEIAVIDGSRGFGNGLLLPAGPLREKPDRLDEVDFIVTNGPASIPLPKTEVVMDIQLKHLCNLSNGETQEIEQFLKKRRKVHAIAGIGNPERFFNSLCSSGFDIITHVFPDHHTYTMEDIFFSDDFEVVMTEKDALKCKAFASEQHWFLKIEASLDDSFFENLLSELKKAKKR